MSGPIVSDAGPLHYLILVDCADALPQLFERVLIPAPVRDELLHRSTAQKVKDWVENPPPWLKIQAATRFHPVPRLHRGETTALQLALQTRTSAVLMDDLDGRGAARRLGLTAVGTVGVLERMAELGFIDLPVAIAKLRQTNFFISPELLDAALERDRRRRAP
jgi:predicted nucleic acid-binding protein